MPDDCIDTVVTSPPYWALRDYSEPGQWGMETSYATYLDNLGRMMIELHRVTKPTGSVWINLGDTYADSGKGASPSEEIRSSKKESWSPSHRTRFDYGPINPRSRCLIPERFAVRCVDAGWILRNDVIWHKQSSLPSSTKNRLTNKYEHIYFFTRESTGYFFDLDNIRVPSETEKPTRPFNFKTRDTTKSRGRAAPSTAPSQHTLDDTHAAAHHTPPPPRKSTSIDTQLVRSHNGNYQADGTPLNHPKGKNPGDVITRKFDLEGGKPVRGAYMPDGERNDEQWYNPRGKNPGDVQNFAREMFPEAHFAVFPPSLVEWILLAACPSLTCVRCGAPHNPVVVPSEQYRRELEYQRYHASRDPNLNKEKMTVANALGRVFRHSISADYIRTGYEPSCKCNADTQPGIVLDPFMGAGSTAVAAERQHRRWTGIELSKDYIALARRRLESYQNKPLD